MCGAGTYRDSSGVSCIGTGTQTSSAPWTAASACSHAQLKRARLATPRADCPPGTWSSTVGATSSTACKRTCRTIARHVLLVFLSTYAARPVGGQAIAGVLCQRARPAPRAPLPVLCRITRARVRAREPSRPRPPARPAQLIEPIPHERFWPRSSRQCARRTPMRPRAAPTAWLAPPTRNPVRGRGTSRSAPARRATPAPTARHASVRGLAGIGLRSACN